jgi:hypothetical protein
VLLALATPGRTGHLLGAHQFVLQTAAAVCAGAPLDEAAAAGSSRAETQYGPGTPATS